MATAQDVQNGATTIMALKALYDAFQPKEEPKPMHVVIDTQGQPIQAQGSKNTEECPTENEEERKRKLRENTYLGLNNLTL